MSQRFRNFTAGQVSQPKVCSTRSCSGSFSATFVTVQGRRCAGVKRVLKTRAASRQVNLNQEARARAPLLMSLRASL